MIKEYYIYRHIRLDNNQPFYIGKGTLINSNSFLKQYARAYSKQGRNTYWENIVNSVGYSVEILFSSDNEIEIFNKETEFIKLYGRKDLGSGILVNMSFGGEGESGRIFTDIHKKRLSDSKTGISTATEYSRKKTSDLTKGDKNYFYGKKLTGERNGFFGKKHSEEFKIKNSYGAANPMFGKTGELNPFYGKTHSKEFLRKKQILHSNPVTVIFSDGNSKKFDCVSDAAEYFKTTSENIRFRNKQRLAGNPAKFGKFKGINIVIND